MAAKARASAGRTNRQKTGRPVYGSAYVHGTAAPKLEPKTAPSPERPGKSRLTDGQYAPAIGSGVIRNGPCIWIFHM